MSDPTRRYRYRCFPLAVLTALALSACNSYTGEPSAGPAPEAAERSARDSRDPYVLSRDELENIRVRRFEELLIARFPSVRVIRRGGEYIIRIRSAGNLTGGGDPLFVVDGMPTPTSSLANLNPADIDRIEVVENHRTAFYGVRGAFGVILVTTSRP